MIKNVRKTLDWNLYATDNEFKTDKFSNEIIVQKILGELF